MTVESKYFKRGDKVKFLGVVVPFEDGEKKYHPVETYIWGVNPHEAMSYVIEHPDGLDKSNFINDPDSGFEDGFEAVHSSDLKDGLKYIAIFHDDNLIELLESGDEPKPINWQSRNIFKRGDRVNYRPQNFKNGNGDETTSGDVSVSIVKDDRILRAQNGGKDFKPVNGTYVWTHFGHLSFEGYVIQHPDGFDKSHFINDPDGDFDDGFEAVHSSQLKDGLKYIWADESELEIYVKKPQDKKPAIPPAEKIVSVQKTEEEKKPDVAEFNRTTIKIVAYTGEEEKILKIIQSLHTYPSLKLSETDMLMYERKKFSNLKQSGSVFTVWSMSNNPMAFYYLGQQIYKQVDIHTEPYNMGFDEIKKEFHKAGAESVSRHLKKEDSLEFKERFLADFDSAKMLKGLGFDELCMAFYEDDGEFKYNNGTTSFENNYLAKNKSDLEYYTAPLWPQIKSWLWEKYCIEIYPSGRFESGQYRFRVYEKDTFLFEGESKFSSLIVAEIEGIKSTVRWLYEKKST